MQVQLVGLAQRACSARRTSSSRPGARLRVGPRRPRAAARARLWRRQGCVGLRRSPDRGIFRQ
eukprot:8661613-Pyramimonas_sp.AAC.1